MTTQSSFNIVFAGTPAFSAEILSALIASRHTIKAVYTQPDRPAGRGQKLTMSPVKTLALQHHLPVYQPEKLRGDEAQLAALQPDLMVVVAYGLLLPKTILDIPPLGCINVHASLLPRWRGAAPIQRAILAGDATTGVTIMRMDVGLDTGDMLYKTVCPIDADETSESLHFKLAKQGARALLEALDVLTRIIPEPQEDALATYAHKISKTEALLDWNLPAYELERHVRGFNPWPVANIGQIRIWQARAIEQTVKSSVPGTILQMSPEGIDVATGEGVLRLLKLQLPGGRVLSASDIVNARRPEFVVGNCLLSP